MKRKSKKICITVLFALTIVFILMSVWSNTYIQTNKIVFESSNVPSAFDGVRIVQISDYHNHGKNFDKRLLAKIDKVRPDYIFLTGDIADSICTDIDAADSFLKKISQTAPCYLVWGNHDYKLTPSQFDTMNTSARESGIIVLDDDFTYITKNSDKILITGTDPYLITNKMNAMLSDYPNSSIFSIWLHHCPEDFEKITDISRSNGCQADLIFSGHAHGGLIRMPFIKGLYAPGQGFFPAYTKGIYDHMGTRMIVSGGVGNSGYTRRFLDPFDLVVCTLKKGK